MAFQDYEQNSLISLQLQVSDIPDIGEQRVYKSTVETIDGETAALVVWEQWPAVDTEWKPGQWYQLQDVLIKQWPHTTELHTTAQTTVNPIDPPQSKSGPKRTDGAGIPGPSDRCGFAWPETTTAVDMNETQHSNCCYRHTWRDFDRCIWHANTTARKEIDELEAQRESAEYRKQNGNPRELLCGANLAEVDLGEMILTRTNLMGADLKSAKLTDTFLNGANLSQANLSEADLSSSHLSWVNFTDTDLIDANLANATLVGTDLTNADLSGADLSGATLRKADLTNAALRNVKLTDTQKDEATGLDLDHTNNSTESDGADEAAIETLQEIPGIGQTRARELEDAGYESVSAIADAAIRDLTRARSISSETAKSIRVGAKEVRGDEKTPITQLAQAHDVDRTSVADAYASVAYRPGSLSEKLTALEEMLSNDWSILNLDGHSVAILYMLYSAEFETIPSVATASMNELTDIPYVTARAEEIRSSARSVIGYSETSELNGDQQKRSDSRPVCEGCGQQFESSSELTKHSHSCDGVESGKNRDKAEQKIELSSEETRPTGFTHSALAALDVGDGETPDSTPIVQAFTDLQHILKTDLGKTEWFQRYVWSESFQTPYIGPDDPNESAYVWLGLVDKRYASLSRQSKALQIEFGVDGNARSAFLNREVIWGIFLGRWTDDDVLQTIKQNLRRHSHVFAQFFADHEEYVFVTKDKQMDNPSPQELRTVVPEIEHGFAVTLDLELNDLRSVDYTEISLQVLSELVPLYRLLAGVQDAPPVTIPSGVDQGDGDSLGPLSETLDIETLASATSLTLSEIEGYREYMTANGCPRSEAIEYIQRYLIGMLEGDGLFAVSGVGPWSGWNLTTAGIKTVESLQSATPDEVSKQTGLSAERVQHLRDAAQAREFTSLDPDNMDIAERLLETQSQSNRKSNSGHTSTTKDQSQAAKEQSAPERVDELPHETLAEWNDGQSVLSPDELPSLAQSEDTPTSGDVYPNYLTEYYEAFRNARKVLELVFQIEHIDIDPTNRQDPRVQFFILLDACIGFTDLSIPFTGYGPQHQDRLPFSVEEYCETFGNGRTIIEYQGVDVKPFADETRALLQRAADVAPSTRFVRPCVPGTDRPVPELPGSFEELQQAMILLDQFPAYPPLQTENGTNDRTIPIAEIYQMHFAELEKNHQVDLTPFTSSHDTPTGPVTDATPTSDSEAESKLREYGRLSHLFRRVKPPQDAPIQRKIGILALDWYQRTSPSFNALRGLAKFDENEPVDAFRPRLQDLIHRRFLLDSWQYDYITVFPGHEADSLSPQLVQLAQDAVLETDIIYTPLLQRTETVDRQRNKSKEERQEVAINPSASLRVRSKLDGETVILFDDICTTGSSLLAGTHLLREAGAGRVVCLTLGSTPGGPREHITEIKDPEAVFSEILAGGG